MSGKKDPELGKRIKQHLTMLGLETVVSTPMLGNAAIALERGVSAFLRDIGLDVTDPSIADTPGRVADMFTHELCYGLDYNNFPKCTVTPNGQPVTITKTADELRDRKDWSEFVSRLPIDAMQSVRANGSTTFEYASGRVDEMVMVDTINTVSLCEHHFQTISGVTHIAYIPGETLLGLSKFARVVNFFARRPQVQERMTEQIYAALSFILGTDDVAVMQVATHNCMRARGAMDPHSKTTTSKMGGRFRSQGELRTEFLMSIPKVSV